MGTTVCNLYQINGPEFFTSSDPDIRKKRIKDITIVVDDYLHTNKDRKFVFVGWTLMPSWKFECE